MPTDRDPFDIHLQDQVAAAFADLPDEVTNALGEALGAFYLALVEREVPVSTIAGAAHAIVGYSFAPLLVMEATGDTAGGDTGHAHRWGAGLGEQFTLGSVEDHGGKLLQVCPDCGARRQV